MVQLTFDASKYPPGPLEPDVDTATANAWDPTPMTQLDYILACQTRKKAIDDANKRWRHALREASLAKILAENLRDEWHAIKSSKPPRSPYAEIILAGGQIDPDLAND